MPFVRHCLLLLIVAGLRGPAFAFPMPHVDRYGDPLPAGAAARLGTVRLRADCSFVVFLTDGKSLLGVAPRSMHRWNSADGRFVDVREFPIPGPFHVGTTANGQTLVLMTDSKLALWHLASGEQCPARLPIGRNRLSGNAVSNDHRFALVAESTPIARNFGGGLNAFDSTHRLSLWNAATGTAQPLTDGELGFVCLGFSADGKRAFATNQLATRVWDTTTGKKLWEVRAYNAEVCHFTPDGKYLIASPGGGQRQWHVWETDTGKPAAFRPPTVGYVWSFAVSPNGNELLIPTDTDYVLWDLEAGEARYRWPGANQNGRGTFAPDGRSVITHDTILRRWDLATGKNLYEDVSPLGHTAPVRRVFFTPDSKRLVSVGDDRTARVWDLAITEPIRNIPIPGVPADWSLTPDGSNLIGVDRLMTVARFSLTADRMRTVVNLREAQDFGQRLRTQDAHILPDGTLAVLAWPKSPDYQLRRFSFSFWNPGTGRLLRWGGDPGEEFRGDSVRLSPDGRLAASSEAAFDTRTGAKHVLPGSPFGLGGTPVFSPDGRLMAATARDTRVWELAAGRVLADLPGGSTDHAAFSPDGRRFAWALQDRLVVWDFVGRKTVTEWPVPDAAVGPVAFSPDGRTLATGHADGTILLWKVPPPIPDGRWSVADAAAAWDALVEDNPGNAYAAVWQLSDYPSEVVPYLRGKFALAPVAGTDEWPKLIAALDSPRFAEREAASKRVRELGRAAEGPLRQALKQAPTPEQVARIDALLAALEPPARLTGEDLRAVRAVAVLEACATTEARRLLAEWAERGTPPRLADEAARSLGRLKYRLP
jgi:WD40 repeat protein